MPTDVLILGATALLAVVALVAAVVTVRAARIVTRAAAEQPDAPTAASTQPVADASADDDVLLPVPYEAPAGPLTPSQARVVEGRVVIVPTEQQVVATALNRPATRLTVVVHGIAHALRPESRDRIAALMRRELNRRRRERSRAARRAAHTHVPAAAPNVPSATSWVATDTDEHPGGRTA